jgi:hypothetical protein
MNLNILIGYGVYLDGDTKYQEYLDRSLEILKSSPAEVLITSGGNVNRNYPYYSEAESVANYLVSNLRSLEMKTILEESSFTASQKIRNCHQIAVSQNYTPSKLSVVCDSLDIPKIFFLTMYFFNDILNNNFTEEDIYISLLRFLENIKDFSKSIQFEFGKCSFYGLPREHNLGDIYHSIVLSMAEIGFAKFQAAEQIHLKKLTKDLSLNTAETISKTTKTSS